MATSEHDRYQSPFSGRYASEAMQTLFSSRHRTLAWRRVWIALAKAQMALGVLITDPASGEAKPISSDQIAQLEAARDTIDFDRVKALEADLRHDVMAHVHAFGEQAPDARAILHWGATSCDVTDNGDLLIYRDALTLLHARTLPVLRQLRAFAEQYASLPTLGYTHYQPAQPTTVGMRASLWLQDLLEDARQLEAMARALPMRGMRGATGTQASFLAIMGGDETKVAALEKALADDLGFDHAFPVTGQTYPRKLDAQIVSLLAGIGQSASKLAHDLRLLAHDREMEEPFGAKQIGSSAMPHKRNPMRAERLTAIARHLIHLPSTAWETAATQWLERTLDDSAARRIVMADAFLAADSLLLLLADVTAGLVVNEAIIKQRLAEEIPFLASEPILMAAVARGGDRQALHEALRQHAQAAAGEIKAGRPNDLLQRIRSDERFNTLDLDALTDAASPAFIGRAPVLCRAFLREHVDPYLAQFAGVDPPSASVSV